MERRATTYDRRAARAGGLKPETETYGHIRRLQRALMDAMDLADYWKERAMMREARRRARGYLVLTGLLLCSAMPVAAETQLSVNSANFYWLWEPAGGPLAAEFRVKCGLTSGVYPIVAVTPDPAARSYPVRSLVAGGSGIYYCVVTAATPSEESAPTNEIMIRRQGQRLYVP